MSFTGQLALPSLCLTSEDMLTRSLNMVKFSFVCSPLWGGRLCGRASLGSGTLGQDIWLADLVWPFFSQASGSFSVIWGHSEDSLCWDIIVLVQTSHPGSVQKGLAPLSLVSPFFGLSVLDV